MKSKVEIYDTTLRDGAQQAGISFSVRDKLVIAQRLDAIGVDYIELGWPGANEKDSQVFKAIEGVHLQTAKIVAFGMTCAKGNRPQEDQQLAKLLAVKTETVAIVGKASSWQVKQVLGISLERNLRLIEESCSFLVGRGRVVFFDAEHFFDGYKQDCAYALACLLAACKGGASRIILCDTNGGSMPWEIAPVVEIARKTIGIPLGIHTHNDAEMAVANSLMAVQAGVSQVQVTINGYGERCGNANLCSVVPALKAKMGIECISDESMARLTELSWFTAELANLPPDHRQPYVGKNAFRHKAGLHVNAVSKDSKSYNHINPEIVGNVPSVVVSELSGKSNVAMKATELGITLTPEQIKKVLLQVEKMESRGFQFEGADGSLTIMMMRHLNGYNPPFEILERDINSRQSGRDGPVDSAIVKLRVNNGEKNVVHHVANGDGPVNALDNALRKALLPHFPYLERTKLTDYKVRVLPGKRGTGKAVRILIDFSDGRKEWTTVGCSTDSIEASMQALLDGFEYAILRAQ